MLGGFFDAQGHALLDGNLAVPPGRSGIEGIVTDGATYEYYGPVLALLRLPVLALTHGLDRRLTQLSMLLAIVVLLIATPPCTGACAGGCGPVRRSTGARSWLAALLQLALGGGIVLYLAAWPSVYHETELWGAALAVASLWAISGCCRTPPPAGSCSRERSPP